MQKATVPLSRQNGRQGEIFPFLDLFFTDSTVFNLEVDGMQLRKLSGQGASVAAGEYPIPGGHISGFREKGLPGNQGFGGFNDASQRSCRGWASQRRMRTRAGFLRPRTVTLYLCR